MAYNTKNLLTDAGTKQIPQFYDSVADDYYALLGTAGAGPRYVNFDTSGNELFVAANPGIVGGTAAHDAAASGNPVQAGGVYRVADPTLDDGDAGSLRVNAKGELITETQLTGSSLAVANVQNVTTAGTRVQLSAVACREITIIAKRANTGYIYVGSATVSSTVYGAELEAKDSITIPVSNTNEIYIDASVSGEGISYVAV